MVNAFGNRLLKQCKMSTNPFEVFACNIIFVFFKICQVVMNFLKEV
jgi:hypothetical protein